MIAYVRRFISNAGKAKRRRTTFLTSGELLKAKERILYSSQQHFFKEEIEMVSKGKALPKRHSLVQLSPYLDDAGLLRADTRLSESDLPELSTCPIVLSPKSKVVQLMVKEIHVKMRHVGASATMAAVAQSFHIPRLKQMLVSIRKNCIECQKRWAKPAQQSMGNLPSVRTEVSKVFESVGVDYAGPVIVKSNKGRRYFNTKTYLALFVCMATRAIHIEVVADASTPAFLAALDRFSGRRGKPAHLYSDNGGNFVGANAQLRHITAEIRKDENRELIHEWSSEQGAIWHEVENIRWHFQPPKSPNFGGLWEAGVKSMKNLMKSSLRDINLSYDELVTLAVSAEAVLNSRPYLPLQSTDPDGLCPLTPGHFIVNRPLTALPQQVDVSSKVCLLRRWNLVKRLEYQLWMRWKKLYLAQLRGRKKQQKSHPNLKIDDVVMLMDDDLPRNQWPLGRIVDVFPGPDGKVRVANVKVVKRIFKRSIRHLIPIPVQVNDPHLEPDSEEPCGGECSGLM